MPLVIFLALASLTAPLSIVYAENSTALKIGVIGRTVLNFPFYIAGNSSEINSSDNQLIKVIHLDSVRDALEALNNGGIHAWGGVYTDLALAEISKGQQILIGVQIIDKLPYRYVTRQGRSALDRNRLGTVGVSFHAVNQERELISSLGYHDLSKISTKPVSSSTDKIFSLLDHEIDGAFIATETIEQHLFWQTYSRDELKIHLPNQGYLPYPFMVVVFNKTWAKQNTEKASLLRSKIRDSLVWFDDVTNHKEIMYILEDKLSSKNLPILKTAVKDYLHWDTYSATGEIDCDKIIQMSSSYGKLPMKKESIFLAPELCRN